MKRIGRAAAGLLPAVRWLPRYLRLARVKPHVLAVLQADGIVDRIGIDHIHGNVYRAVDTQLAGDGRGA